jgi:hypothetical protein
MLVLSLLLYLFLLLPLLVLQQELVFLKLRCQFFDRDLQSKRGLGIHDK